MHLAELAIRVEALERENRRLKVVGGAVVAVIAAAILLGATIPQDASEVIEAREYRVVDDFGVTRVVMNVQAITHYDENGSLRAHLATATPGAEGIRHTAVVVLYDEDGNVIWRAAR